MDQNSKFVKWSDGRASESLRQRLVEERRNCDLDAPQHLSMGADPENFPNRLRQQHSAKADFSDSLA